MSCTIILCNELQEIPRIAHTTNSRHERMSDTCWAYLHTHNRPYHAATQVFFSMVVISDMRQQNQIVNRQHTTKSCIIAIGHDNIPNLYSYTTTQAH